MAKRTISKCACGKRKSRHVNECNTCEAARREAYYAKAQAIVATGKCPKCGSALRRNTSLTGWWQCEQYGAETHRARPDDPSCDFQTFTKE